MGHKVKDAQAGWEDPVATANRRTQRCQRCKRNQAPASAGNGRRVRTGGFCLARSLEGRESWSPSYPTSILRNVRIFRIRAGRLVSGGGFCYHLVTHGLCLTKPLLLLPVDNLRRVSLLVSDLSKHQSIQKTLPLLNAGLVFCSAPAFNATKNERSRCQSPKVTQSMHRHERLLAHRRD